MGASISRVPRHSNHAVHLLQARAKKAVSEVVSWWISMFRKFKGGAGLGLPAKSGESAAVMMRREVGGLALEAWAGGGQKQQATDQRLRDRMPMDGQIG